MRDWNKIDKEAVFTGKDENGNRYLSEFLRDYKEIFNPAIIEPGCRKCLNDYYLKLTSNPHKMKKVKNSGYRLKAKYDGIPLEFGSQTQVFNSNLSDELAKKLIKKHPAGLDLFETVPEEKEAEPEKVTAKSLAKNNSRDDLNAQALELGLEDPESYKTKKEIAQAIFDVLNAEVNE